METIWLFPVFKNFFSVYIFDLKFKEPSDFWFQINIY